MKRFLCITLSLFLVLTLVGCGNNYGSVNLEDASDIPENGVISQNTVKKLKSENAIGIFQGSSNGFDYEWTIFGSDIVTAEEINLKVDIVQAAEGIQLHFHQTKPFDFPALLSVQLSEIWDVQGATAYQDDKPVGSVSLTGSSNTIVNISVREVLGTCLILPDRPEEEIPPENTADASSSDDTKTLSAGNSDAASYLSAVTEESTRVYSDGTGTGLDQYNTAPVPEGKPMPVEPENQQINTDNAYTCTFSIECSTILNNLDMLDPDKLEMVPSNGMILAATSVTFYEGESVFDVLQRVCRENGIHMEASWTPIYNSAYVEGIHNLYEFDCGTLSGWMYNVDGWYPNYGCSRYQLKPGEVVQWRYTCDLGSDVGGAYAVTG